MEFKVLNNKLYRNLQRDDTKVGLSQRVDLITGPTPKKIKKNQGDLRLLELLTPKSLQDQSKNQP